MKVWPQQLLFHRKYHINTRIDSTQTALISHLMRLGCFERRVTRALLAAVASSSLSSSCSFIRPRTPSPFLPPLPLPSFPKLVLITRHYDQEGDAGRGVSKCPALRPGKGEGWGMRVGELQNVGRYDQRELQKVRRYDQRELQKGCVFVCEVSGVTTKGRGRGGAVRKLQRVRPREEQAVGYTARHTASHRQWHIQWNTCFWQSL